MPRLKNVCFYMISTHTPHARRDYVICAKKFELIISTHTPHARRDHLSTGLSLKLIFQLTRLMRGVTFYVWKDEKGKEISTHTPHARRDLTSYTAYTPFMLFQLTRLMRGVTQALLGKQSDLYQFQLTRLMRGVTISNSLKLFNTHISTHTPHARRDNTKEQQL